MAKHKHKKAKQKEARARKRRKTAAAAKVTTGGKISRVRPSAYKDESVEDRAVFDDATLKTLPKEMAEQVVRVRSALELLQHFRDASAESVLACIPRRSPMSDWRLFVRGLTAWYAGQTKTAEQSFARLDPNRRPARIAQTLRCSDQMKADWIAKSTADPTPKPMNCPPGVDQALFSGANLVHRLRNVRRVLTAAERNFSKREPIPEFDDSELSESMPDQRQVAWMTREFEDNLRQEPELTRELAENLLRCFHELPAVELLESFAQKFPGLDHDPHNFLRRLLYYSKFQDAEKETAEARKRCLDFLRKTPPVPKPVAAALIAEIHLSAALEEQGSDDEAGGIYAMFYAAESDEAVIQKHFTAATKACPGHISAHRQHIRWLESELEAPRLAKAREKKLKMELATAMVQFARGCPDEIEPRLWLVDHYLENEKLELAEPHVQWLGGSRNLDLRVHATRWKWHVLEAMRLCRRKTWAPQAQEQLDAAEKIWPAWLSQDWLPYLHAARALRTGDSSTHESVRQQIRDSWTDADAENYRLVDAVAALAAAQRMRVPAADLKPLRKPIDELVKEPSVLSNTGLLRAGRFFTELFRAGLVYPAYRMHGSKFADELVFRMLHGEVKIDDTKDADFWPAMFWLGYQRSFVNNNNPNPHIPNILNQLDAPERIGAIILQTFLGGRSAWPFDKVHDAMATVTAAVAREKDPYLKFWYASLIEKVGEKIAVNPFARNMMHARLRSVQSQLDEDDRDDENGGDDWE